MLPSADISTGARQSGDLRLAALLDTSLGYGTPQLELMAVSLRQHYGIKDARVFEPDVKGKPRLFATDGLRIERIATRLPAGLPTFHIEYCRELSCRLREFDPDIVVLTSGTLLPALLSLPRRPGLVIYYMLESLDYQMGVDGGEAILMHHMARDWIDVLCVPEIHRAWFDLRRLGWLDMPVMEILNVSSHRFQLSEKVDPPRILNAGSICEDTLCDYFADPRFNGFAIDVCGILASQRMRDLFNQLFERNSSVVYLGSLTSEELKAIYGRYAFSLCMWKTSNVNQIHASPNKFFQGIAYGVPPIAAPHPQCVRIIREYGCGVLMEGWGREHVLEAIARAMAIYGTSDYAEMVENCRYAFDDFLNWPAQFAVLAGKLPDLATTFRVAAE